MDTDKQLETTPEQTKTLQKSTLPPLPKWPTSKRGPMVTEPPSGSKRMHLRPEQVTETDYDQEHGKRETPKESY
ncbi:MAG TPA: hypothetical protein VGT44_19895 [Ktedonobacteraceae bacterium]|nr:hypothetical protein [Ktedonobacteraceae bacterium]